MSMKNLAIMFLHSKNITTTENVFKVIKALNLIPEFKIFIESVLAW